MFQKLITTKFFQISFALLISVYFIENKINIFLLAVNLLYYFNCQIYCHVLLNVIFI